MMKKLRKTKYHVSRPHDYIYDPNCHLSHPKDHRRAAIESFNRVAEFQICPNFSTMFSDLKNYPPACLKVKCPDRVPSCVDRTWKGRSPSKTSFSAQQVEVDGIHRHLFYCRPLIPYLTPPEPYLVEKGDECESGTIEQANKEHDSELDSLPNTRTLGIQTKFRDSEAQTIPYSPNVTVFHLEKKNVPEVLTLEHLKWGQGLPAGLKDVENFEWEKNQRSLKTLLEDPSSMSQVERVSLLEYIHKEEWVHREKEIQEIHDLRMQLAEELMNRRGGELSDRLEEMISRKYECKLQEKSQKIQKIRDDHRRALRKLINKHKGISMKYKRPDPITEQADYSSELYGPLMRHGADPRHRHEVPLGIRSKFLYDYKGLQVLEKANRWLNAPKIVPLKEKPEQNIICTRGARWSDDQLLKLQQHFEGLLSAREDINKKKPNLMKRLPRPVTKPAIPTIKGIPESKEKLYQAAIFMQKIIQGRAIQLLMFQGKEKYQDLIDEIRSTHALLDEQQSAVNEERITAKAEYQDWMDENERKEILRSMESSYIGETIGSMLDFLSKELVRLEDERSMHALLLLADRERHQREAAEAGQRQVEERRRREHDEAFKQVVKVHQETVDMYLEDVVLNALDWVSTAESRDFVRELAREIDQKTKDLEERDNILEYKELVTDLVYEFMLPEVHKEFLQQKSDKEQERYLGAIQQEADKTLSDPERQDLLLTGMSVERRESGGFVKENHEEFVEEYKFFTHSDSSDGLSEDDEPQHQS